MSAASAEALRIARARRRRRRALRPLLVLRELAALRVRRARASRPTDPRGLTVTGGLPYHGGPASGYLTHSIAAMVERLRARSRRARARVSGVGMHMTKHVFGVYSTTRRPYTPPPSESPHDRRSPASVVRDVRRRRRGSPPTRSSTGATETPEWGLLVCDLPDGTRTYAQLRDRDACASAEHDEFVGTTVRLEPIDGRWSDGRAATVNIARMIEACDRRGRKQL